MAAALSVIVWRMLRDERQRSDARVAVLAGMTARNVPAPRQEKTIDLPIRSSAPVTMHGMFEEPEATSPWGHRAAVMAGLALVLASVVLFSLAIRDRSAHAARAASPGATGTAPGATAPGGLELISLRDARKAESLTITGMVRNPEGGAPLTRVAVTAYTFDDKGAFLASGRALIDVTSLAPGDESPFVVTVPVTDTVARYRIGFRGEDGHVIAHVDKRQPGPIAQVRSDAARANW